MVRYVDPVDGQHLLCMWAECERAGDDRHLVIVREPYGVDPRSIIRPAPNMRERWKDVNYLFCSERHKAFFVNSHRDNNNLPTGSKGTLL